MSLNANKSKNTGSSSGNAPALDSGTYPGRLVSIVDLGKQPQRPYQGQEKEDLYEVMTTYELLDEFMLDEEGNEDKEKPRWVSERFPLFSLNSERAKSTARYMALDPQNIDAGDWVKQLGKAVNVTLIQNPGKGKHAGKVFTNIAGTTPMRAKDAEKAPELVNASFSFDLDNPDMDVWDALFDWMKAIITSGSEFEYTTLGKMLNTEPTAQKDTSSSDEDDSATTDEAPY